MQSSDWFLKQFIVLDGGMGRQIEKRGLPYKQPQWSAEIIKKAPEALIDIHSDFIDSGAQIITTNTYAVAPYHIGQQTFLKQGPDMIRLACDMAIRSKRKSEHNNVKIAFSIPPLFGSYRYDLFEANIDKAQKFYKHFIDSIKDIEGQIDLFLCQTLSSVGEAIFISELLQKYSKPYAISFCLDEETCYLKKGTYEQLGEFLKKIQKKPKFVMLNCSKPEIISQNVDKLRNVLPQGIRLGCYGNNFEKTYKKANDHSPNIRTDLSVDDYQQFIEQWIQKGARLVGGCCGIGPQYIPGVVRAVQKHSKKE